MHSRQIKKIQKLLEFWKSSQPLNERLQRSIEKLKSSGLLVRIGADKNGYWRILGE